ncbi:MAG: acylphosphatase [Fimbriimonadaceae bacterium]
MPTYRFLVRGRVQGVGFRQFVRRSADRLGIRGEVWNRIDGNVEGVASHADPGVLQQFLESLKDGPGRVDDLQSWNEPDVGSWTGFEIGFTR